MSDYGFMSWDPDETFMPVSSLYRNLVIVKKGTSITTTPPSDTSAIKWNHDMGLGGAGLDVGISPIIVTRCTVCPACALVASGTPGGAWNWPVYTKAGSGISVDYWIFDQPANGLMYDTGSARLENYDGTGTKTFDSRMRPMNIREQRAYGGTGEDFSKTATYESGHLWAVGQCVGWGGAGWKSNVNWNFELCYKATATGFVYEGVRTFGRAALTNTGPFAVNQSLFIVDVTGL